jgi:hypothetical protein
VVSSTIRLNAFRGTGVASALAGMLTSMERRLTVNNVHEETPSGGYSPRNSWAPVGGGDARVGRPLGVEGWFAAALANKRMTFASSFALLVAVHPRVHRLREVTADPSRHGVVDLCGAGEVVER